ncbi:hypothetical protein IGJ45_003120 [Enterococcus sp. DIV0574]
MEVVLMTNGIALVSFYWFSSVLILNCFFS